MWVATWPIGHSLAYAGGSVEHIFEHRRHEEYKVDPHSLSGIVKTKEEDFGILVHQT